MTREYKPTRTKAGATPVSSFAPVRTGLLQRKCACGGAPSLDGECAECRSKRLGLRRRAVSQTEPTGVPPVVQNVLRSPGRPLDSGTRAFMETRFGHDFGRVRVHADTQVAESVRAVNAPGDRYEQEAERMADAVLRARSPADRGVAPAAGRYEGAGPDFSQVRVRTDADATESARAVGALAYTVGHNIVFGAGQYAPATTTGRRLLAHELSHVLQQKTARASLGRAQPVLQRFGSREHMEIGERAFPGETVLILNYGLISYGEMIALAGDYFESLQEMETLASKYGTFGREQIDFARWKVQEDPSVPKPRVSQAAENAVMDRYYRLAARNETHFSTGSAPGRSNREQYVLAHTAAIRAAYNSGMKPLVVGIDWEAQEAFAQHFLTDAFSSGHVRTPRGQIQAHWNSLYPSFSANLVTLISCYMASYINDKDTVGSFATVDFLTSQIAPEIRSRAGNVLAAFSIGDFISKVMHDADNRGLDVVSPRGPRGAGPSPFLWRAVGDEYLFPSTPNQAATQTQQMVNSAVKLSYSEAEQAYSAGASTSGPTLASMTNPANYRALQFLPAADPTSAANPTYVWKVPSIRALPANLQSLMVEQFQPGQEVRSQLDALSVPCITSSARFDLHTEAAWNCLKALLICDPWAMLVRIAEGDTCPPGQNNPCPAPGPPPPCGTPVTVACGRP